MSATQKRTKHVGARVPRLEDARLLRGQGRFADDVDLPGQLALRVVRSSVAHARLLRVDAEAARSLPGVNLVVTGRDVEVLSTPVPLEQIGYHEAFPDLDAYGYPVLARDKVNYVGQPIAFVVAEDAYIAEDAAEQIIVEYEQLPAVLDPREALEPDAPRLFDGRSNEAAWIRQEYGDVAAAFANAAHRITADFTVGRHAGVPMETRACIADFDAGYNELQVWGPNHAHDNRTLIAQFMGLPLTSVHMRQTDVGGSFGARGGMFPEHVLVPYASRALGRPVKWVEDRAEHFVATSHSREQIHRIEGAFDEEGRILAIRDEIWHNKGAYLRQAAPLVTDITVGTLLGPYRVPAYDGICRAVVTNKPPLGVYRAPGRYEGTFARERLLDLAAQEIGIDPIEIRRRNLLTDDDLPWKPGIQVVGEDFLFNSGDVAAHFETVLSEADFASWQREAEELRDQGKMVGTGMAVLMDKAGLGLYETAEVEVDASGRVRVLTGGSSVGQGIETVLAQIVADELTVEPSDIQVLHGDTDLIPDGVGSWSSRSTVIAGGAAQAAARRTVEKALRIAGERLEAAVDDLTLEHGRVAIIGSPDRSMSLGEIAAAWDGWTARLAGDEPGLKGRDVYLEDHMNYPYGVTLVQLEIDPQTGGHEIRRFFTSCEAGKAINPLTTEGQVIGAAAQGIGGALFEEFVYDESGQPLTTSFIDYLIPTANEVPRIELLVTEDAPTPDNPFGAKGIGEVGLIAAGAAIAAAIDDAIGKPGTVRRLPVTPATMYRFAADARPAADSRSESR